MSVPCFVKFTHEGQQHNGWIIDTRGFGQYQQLQFIVACPAFKAPVILEQSQVESHGVITPPYQKDEAGGPPLWSVVM